jgi:hypothetical protein
VSDGGDCGAAAKFGNPGGIIVRAVLRIIGADVGGFL